MRFGENPLTGAHVQALEVGIHAGRAGLVTPRGNEEDAVCHRQSQGEDLMRIKTYLEAKKGVNGWVEGR
jgi:hypothetical protein